MVVLLYYRTRQSVFSKRPPVPREEDRAPVWGKGEGSTAGANGRGVVIIVYGIIPEVGALRLLGVIG